MGLKSSELMYISREPFVIQGETMQMNLVSAKVSASTPTRGNING
jgi:hypothetical protein